MANCPDKLMSRMAAVALALLISLWVPTVGVARDDAATIRNVFDGYKNALLEKRGRDSVRFVHPRTIGYFGELRKLAVTAKAHEVRKFSLFDQIMVLYFRLEFGERQLAEMSAEDVFAVAVDRGLIGSNLHLLGVGKVAITSNGARGQATRNGKATRLFFRFRKADDGSWRLDLGNLIALGDRVFEAMRQRQKASKEDFVLSLLRAAAAKPVPNDIWSARPDR